MKNDFPIINTERTMLRQITSNDLENIYHGLSNPEVIKYYGVHLNTLEDTKTQLVWFANLEHTKTGIWWAICSPDNTTFYGASGFNNLAKEHKKAEIGFWLVPNFWKLGLMTEVLPYIINYGFNKLDLHRIEALVETENHACKNTLTKLDFRHEGTLIDCEIKNGQFISLDIFALLSSKTTQ